MPNEGVFAMRQDVKLGVVLSAVIVFVAGAYYMYRDEQETPIPVRGGSLAVSEPAKDAGQKHARTSTPAKARKPRPATRRTADARKVPGNAPAKRLAAGNKLLPQTRPATQAVDRTTTGAKDLRKTGRNRGKSAPAKKSSKTNALAQGGVDTTESTTTAAGVPLDRSRRAVPLVARKTPAAKENKIAIETHRVQPGDTLASLAQRYYGSAALAKFLADGNPQLKDAGRLSVGEVVKIPPRPSSAAPSRPNVKQATANAATDDARTYRVKSGDSFYKIAERELGDASRWKELFELNRDLVRGNPKHLRINQVISLPPR